MQKRYLLLLLVPLVLVGSWYIKKYINLQYTKSRADQAVVEITAKTSGGVYVDATQAIRDGITQLTSSGGGILFFGPGEYLVQETIVIPSNITIQGVGAGEVGPTMIILGNNGDLDATGMSLLSIAPGAVNVVIKDIELRSMTPGPNFYPRNDLDRIQSEQTTAIQIYGNQSTTTSNLLFQNVRITNFTYGIDVGSNDNSDPVVDNVKIKNVAMPVNYLALRVKSLNARNWDVQNLNIVEMSAGQNGALLERAGTMSFMEMFCASTLHNGNLCLDIGQRSGALYFVQWGYEGPSEGFRVRASSNYPIYFEDSAAGGVIEQQNTIYSIANMFSLDDTRVRMQFTGGGAQSTLYTCRDVFTNYSPNPTERVPSDPYPGLATIQPDCNFDVTSIGPTFSTGANSFSLSDWVTSGVSPSATYINVKNFGAVGDGVTDDTAAFRAAMQDSPSVLWSANTIVVPAGTYRITDTLTLEDGITFQGASGAFIRFDATNRPLFKINAMSSDPIIKRGLGLRNLTISTSNSDVLGQQTSAIEMTGDLGVTGDVMLTDLDISNFTRGVYVHGVPELDTMSMRNLTFNNNSTAMDINDDNMSNWNLENIQILGMTAGQRGIALDHGGFSVRGLTCVGESASTPAEACMYLSRFGSLYIDGLTSTNTKYAFYGDWPDGWMSFPVVIKNSNLRDGFYSAGKMYLMSSKNVYAGVGDGQSTLGSGSVFFDAYGSLDPLNIYPGAEARIASCGDVFMNGSGVSTGTLSFNGLTNAPQTCVQAPPVDSTAPDVSITAPSEAAIISGSNVVLSATATDNVGVVGVQFKLDGTNVGSEDTSAPYSVTWDSTNTSDGSHSITATARDAAGNITTSSAVTVVVSNITLDTTAPNVAITAPINNSQVSGSAVVVSATATDNVGVVGVQFKLDGTNLGSEDTSLPYDVVWDSTQDSNANHIITAVARDAAGNSTTSALITVTVTNIVPPLTVAIPTISPNGGSYGSSQTITLSTTTAGATIYYTINNSTPTTSSTQYATPFVVAETATVNAIAVKSGLTDSAVSSATFTITPPTNSGGGNTGGGGGGGTNTPPPPPTIKPPITPPITPPPTTPPPTTPPSTPSVILPGNVIAGQVIKFPNSPTIYLVQSTGLHPFDTWSSFEAYQGKSGAKIITRQGTASTYTVSPILASTKLDQAPTPAIPTTLPADQTNFVCSGSKTIYFYYKGKKEAYSEPVVYEVWNGKNYTSIQSFSQSICDTIPNNGLARLPDGTLVKIAGGKEIYQILGTTARPFANNTAYLQSSKGKVLYIISVDYLHTYSRGEIIN